MPEIQKRIKALEQEAADCASIAALTDDVKVKAHNNELARKLRLEANRLRDQKK
jgi:hypothetical protein